MKHLSFIAICVACVATVGAVDLADLIIPSPAPAKETVNPDDVMLRRPDGRNRADMEARAKAAAAAAEAQERAKAEAEAKAKAEAERKAKEEAAKAAAEAEAKAKAEAERKAKEEAAKAAAEAEAKAKAEAERKAREEAAKAAAEAEAKAKAEAERMAQEEAARAAAEAEANAKAEAERKAKEEAAKAAAEAEAKAKSEAEEKKQEVSASGKDKPGKDKKSDKKAKVKVNAPRTGRDAVITSERTDYDRKEGIILFDRNVFVDDEQYQMHADRLFVFLDGTNDLKRIVAIGNVSITNEARTASCSKAVFTKAASKIVMYGDDTTNAKLSDPSQRGGMVEGKKITFWLDAEQVSVEGSVVNLPGGMLKGKDPKKLLEHGK